MNAVNNLLCQYLNDNIIDPTFSSSVPSEIYAFVFNQVNQLVEADVTKRLETFFPLIWDKTQAEYSKQIEEFRVQLEKKRRT